MRFGWHSLILAFALLTLAGLGGGAGLLVTQKMREDALTRRLGELRQRVLQARRNLKMPLATTAGQPDPANASTRAELLSASIDTEVTNYFSALRKLKEWIAVHPDQQIAELSLLLPQDWFPQGWSLRIGPMLTDDDCRQAAGRTRRLALNDAANRIRLALSSYADANVGSVPGSVWQLVPYFDPPIGPAILQNWEINAATHQPRRR